MLGLTCKDRITGFTGVVMGHCFYLSGCSQALLVPPMHEGKLQESQWFDVQRLEDTGAPAIVLENGDTPGFDKAAPKR
jgi:hypothetical protein